MGFDRIEDLEDALPPELFRREGLPWEAAFLAGKCFLRYRRARGEKRSPLPDFYIGAHASVLGMPLLTRDTTRYRKYFPEAHAHCSVTRRRRWWPGGAVIHGLRWARVGWS